MTNPQTPAKPDPAKPDPAKPDPHGKPGGPHKPDPHGKPDPHKADADDDDTDKKARLGVEVQSVPLTSPEVIPNPDPNRRDSWGTDQNPSPSKAQDPASSSSPAGKPPAFP